jgi:hypothetical protein
VLDKFNIASPPTAARKSSESQKLEMFAIPWATGANAAFSRLINFTILYY